MDATMLKNFEQHHLLPSKGFGQEGEVGDKVEGGMNPLRSQVVVVPDAKPGEQAKTQTKGQTAAVIGCPFLLGIKFLTCQCPTPQRNAEGRPLHCNVHWFYPRYEGLVP